MLKTIRVKALALNVKALFILLSRKRRKGIDRGRARRQNEKLFYNRGRERELIMLGHPLTVLT